MTSATYLYFAIGVSIFLLLAYAIDAERPPAGWWRDRSFLMVALVCFVAWPVILFLWIRKQVQR